jgi:hypothetical protein
VAAPTLVQSGTGAIWTTGAATTVSIAGCIAGNLLSFHVIKDGVTGGLTLTSGSNFETLSGTDNTLTTVLIDQDVGNPRAAEQYVYLARVIADGTVSIGLASGGDDCYARWYEFSGVNAGTTLADVIENGTAGTANNEAGTGTSVTDVAVVTLAADRLALNFVGIDDDATGIGAFAGASGGTWAMPASFESATGTDATIALMTATMATAGTIDGGADTITSDNWGVVGFALIPAVVGGPSLVLEQGFVDYSDPGIL